MLNINLKTFKLFLTSLLLLMILSSCSLPGVYASPTQTSNQNLAINVAATTLQVNPTPTQTVIIPTSNVPTVTVPATPTQIPPNTPVWSTYNYTCDLVSGGSNMTMNLNWSDRSDKEESYIVYRNKLAIATLAPNSTSYVDVAFVAQGKTLSYSVESYNKDWQTSTSTITYGCQ